MSFSYEVIDIETLCFGDAEMGVHPYSKNSVVLVGVKYVPAHGNSSFRFSGSDTIFSWEPAETSPVIVGFNLSFDLGKLFRFNRIIGNLPYIWDCQYYYYLTQGQARFPSLERVAAAYNIPLSKTMNIVEEAQRYGDTDIIPMDKLQGYLSTDVELTDLVFQVQMRKFNELPEKHQLFLTNKMLGLRESILATRNGIPCSISDINNEIAQVESEIKALEDEVSDLLILYALKVDVKAFMNSRTIVLAIINGEEVKVDIRKEVGTYKSGLKAGQPKYKKDAVVCMDKHPTLDPAFSSVQEEDLAKFLNTGAKIAPVRAAVTECVLKYRKALKYKTTYLENLSRYNVANHVHPLFQHCSTATGRMSCSGPNMQNQV